MIDESGSTAPVAGVRSRRSSLVDVIDRSLTTGVVVSGDLVLSIAGVDLVVVDLRALLASVDSVRPPAAPARRDDHGGGDVVVR